MATEVQNDIAKPDDNALGQDPHHLCHLPELSQELYDMIIDALSGPTAREDLKACSLTCRAWLHRSRTRLHGRITLKPLTNYEQYSEIYTEISLLPYVRELVILGCLSSNIYPGEDDDSGLGMDGDPDHRWIDDLIPFLTRFTQINWIHLNDLSWGDIKLETRQFFFTQFRTATRLSLSTVDFWNANQYLQTLSAFPMLKGLSMSRLSWHRANHTRNQVAHTEPLNLGYLHLGETEFARYGPFVRWFLGQRDVVTVDEASVHWEDTEIHSLVDLFRKIVPNLKLLLYQQYITLPGSDIARGDIGEHGGLLVPMVLPAHMVNQANMPAGDNLIQVPAGQPFIDGGAMDIMQDDDSDDEDMDDALDEELDDAGNDNAHSSVEMDGDEPEEREVVEEFVAENHQHASEKKANVEGIALLEKAPIQDSGILRLHARIVWSTMALFGIKMMCQLVSPRTRVFTLCVLVKSKPHLESMNWPFIDGALDGITTRARSDTRFELTIQGPVPDPRTDSNTAAEVIQYLRQFLQVNLPLLTARNVWTLRLGSIEVWVGRSV